MYAVTPPGVRCINVGQQKINTIINHHRVNFLTFSLHKIIKSRKSDQPITIMHCITGNVLNNGIHLSGTNAMSTYLWFGAYEDISTHLCASGSWSIFGWKEILHILCGTVLSIPEMLFVRMRQTDKQEEREKGGIGERTGWKISQ